VDYIYSGVCFDRDMFGVWGDEPGHSLFTQFVWSLISYFMISVNLYFPFSNCCLFLYQCFFFFFRLKTTINLLNDVLILSKKKKNCQKKIFDQFYVCRCTTLIINIFSYGTPRYKILSPLQYISKNSLFRFIV
jgi:hypothetical protein